MKRFAALFIPLALSACATLFGSPPPAAPPPAKPIDAASFFTGRWYEIARTPMSLTTNCMAGTTDFFTRPDGTLVERDACHKGSPTGPEKIFAGPIHILNPGINNEFTVHYLIYGFFPLTAHYWVLDHADDGSWFIVSTPSFHNVAILDRAPNPPQPEIDAAKLEYPPRTPPGG
jgi:apolipoprotein D and lipocalin family protein